MLLKVVIVEDERDHQKGSYLCLKTGWTWAVLLWARPRGGAEGLEAIRREQPDIVLTDT